MGLFQKAYETYECSRALAGDCSTEYREPLAPVAHMITGAALTVTLDPLGSPISIEPVGKDEQKIIIPVTEASASRAGKAVGNNIHPHPLCDQVEYLSPPGLKYEAYIGQLSEWAASPYSHPMLLPILTYVKRGTLLQDLAHNGIESYSEKDLIRWVVIGLSENGGACWTNRALFDAYERFYASKKSVGQTALCMVTGEQTAPAQQHMKGVVSLNGNAKLISANDSSNFTYRGRFVTSAQAATIGYEASQKAHNALKWLVANQGIFLSNGRALLCWNPQGKRVPRPTSPFRFDSEKKTPLLSEYRKELLKELLACKNEFLPTDGIVTAAFDAATSGRLSVTYYSELPANDFLERLVVWDVACCYPSADGNIRSPSLPQMINCAFGFERQGKLTADKKVFDQQLQRLLACRIDRRPIPYDLVQALHRRVSNPLAYQQTHRIITATAFAVIRKYYIDHHQEEYAMALEKDRTDISYQYGRLLAVLDAAERGTFERDEVRETNAVKLQSMFCSRPEKTARIIIEQLKRGYYKKLDQNAAAKRYRGSAFYDGLIGEIYARISEFPESEWNAPLKASYIMGYYLQRNELYKKSNGRENTEMEEMEYDGSAE